MDIVNILEVQEPCGGERSFVRAAESSSSRGAFSASSVLEY